MNGLITICGRGGSKGLRNKNLLDFLGYPLILYTIAAADLFRERYKTGSGSSLDICVNSDSKDILAIASKTGICEIVLRPKELAEDATPKIPVIRHSLASMENRLKKKYDCVIDLDITSPLRKVADIDEAVKTLSGCTVYDVVFSVVPSRRNPYFNMVQLKDGKIQKVMDMDIFRRQDAPAVYDMNASIYCYRPSSLNHRLTKSVFDGNAGIIIMEDTGILDIDCQHDYEMIQVVGQFFYNNYPEFREIRDHASILASRF